MRLYKRQSSRHLVKKRIAKPGQLDVVVVRFVKELTPRRRNEPKFSPVEIGTCFHQDIVGFSEFKISALVGTNPV